jgi:molecular chaperone DnaJ
MQTSSSGGVFAVSEPCRDCRGRGLIVDDPCPECHGSGRAVSTTPLQVRIPAGVTDGQRVRIKGKGGPGENGGASGDLYVLVHVSPHPVFGRQGDNVTVTVPVTFAEAALGANIEVPTLTGNPVTLKLAPGTKNGQVLRVRNRGVAKKGGRGDLLVTVEVTVPTRLSPEARVALEAYQAAVAEPDPRRALFAKAGS